MAFNNKFGTLLYTNDTGNDVIFTFPSSNTSGNYLQVQNISGTIEVKGNGKIFGQNSTFVPVAEGQLMTFSAVGNINPMEICEIKVAPGASASFVCYE